MRLPFPSPESPLARARRALLAAGALAIAATVQAQPSPGQKVDALDPGGRYSAATVLSVDGDKARVRFTGGLWEGDERSVPLKAVRAPAAGDDAAAQAERLPRPAGGYAVKAGTYDCWRVVPVYLGSTSINGTSIPKYRFDRHVAGRLTLRSDGTADVGGNPAAYVYDAASHRVHWRSGPYKGIESTHEGDKLTMHVARPSAIDCTFAGR